MKFKKHKEIIDFLKSEYNLTYGFANFMALKVNKSDAASFEENDLISSQYKDKESLKIIYDVLIAEVAKFGNDIIVTPKKDSVSIIRKKQFALIKPATKTRIDPALKFKDKPTNSRLENSGPFGSMCSHRVQVTKLEDLNTELFDWIKEAYINAK